MDFIDENSYLGETHRLKEEGIDEWSNVKVSTKFAASDGKLFETFDEALEYDKTINVLARHRGALPDKFITYTCADGTKFYAVNFGTEIYNARKYQDKLDEANNLDYIASLLYGQSITDIDDMKNSIKKNYFEIQNYFMNNSHLK